MHVILPTFVQPCMLTNIYRIIASMVCKSAAGDTAADRRLSDAIAVVFPCVSDVLFACMFLLITLHLLRLAAVSASSLHFSPAVMFRWLSSTMYVVFLNLHQLLAQYFISSGLRQLS